MLLKNKTDGPMVYKPPFYKMKKIILLLFSVFTIEMSNAQISLAVMDFTAGTNMSESNVSGLSEMLINSLYESGHYEIAERSHINDALRELNLQGHHLSVSQLIQLGRYLKVDNVLVGTVNFIATGNSDDPGFLEGEYNIDVRIVNIRSSKIVATAGVVKSRNQTYRSLMPELASQLSIKLSANSLPCIQGYLYVYPEYLGKATYSGAEEKCMHLNAANACGRNNWRLPSIDELKAIAANLNVLNYTINDYGEAYSDKTEFDPWANGKDACHGIDCYRVYYYELKGERERWVAGGKDDCWVILVSTK